MKMSTGNENDITVSGSVDSHETECALDDTSLSISPNPFISAFMNRGAEAPPTCPEGWVHAPQSTHSTREYSSPVHTERRCTGLANLASPLFTHTALGQIHSGSVGFRRPLPQGSRGGPPHHQGPGAPDLPYQLPPDHQVEPQHQAGFDYPLPLPPKVSRMHLPESALRCLDMSPSSDPGSLWPLTNILNRIHSRGASGSPGKLLEAQYERPRLGLDRQLRPQPYAPPPEHTGDYLSLHSTLQYQNSLLGSVGPLRDSHVNPRVLSSTLEFSYKTPLLDFFLEVQNGR